MRGRQVGRAYGSGRTRCPLPFRAGFPAREGEEDRDISRAGSLSLIKVRLGICALGIPARPLQRLPIFLSAPPPRALGRLGAAREESLGHVGVAVSWTPSPTASQRARVGLVEAPGSRRREPTWRRRGARRRSPSAAACSRRCWRPSPQDAAWQSSHARPRPPRAASASGVSPSLRRPDAAVGRRRLASSAPTLGRRRRAPTPRRDPRPRDRAAGARLRATGMLPSPLAADPAAPALSSGHRHLVVAAYVVRGVEAVGGATDATHSPTRKAAVAPAPAPHDEHATASRRSRSLRPSAPGVAWRWRARRGGRRATASWTTVRPWRCAPPRRRPPGEPAPSRRVATPWRHGADRASPGRAASAASRVAGASCGAAANVVAAIPPSAASCSAVSFRPLHTSTSRRANQ